MVSYTLTEKRQTNLLSGLVADMGSNLMLYTIVEETPNGVLVVDRKHTVLYGNPSASRLLGLAYGELAGRSLPDLLDLSDDPLFGGKDGFLLSDRLFSDRVRREMTLKTGPGGSRHVVEAVFIRPERDRDYYSVILIDIDERIRLETELRRRNSFFHNLIDSSVDGIIAADMKGRIILFNQGAQSLLGYTEQEALADLHVARLYPEGEAHEILKRMRSDDFGGKGKLLRHELLAVTKDGHQIPMSLSGGIIYDGDQEIATFGIFTDLRQIQKFAEDLEQSHQMLQHSEKMAGLGRLAAGVAHEINNPMSGIMLYANLVREELGDEHPLARDMETIIHEAERCKVIVADLLEFSHQTSYDMGSVNLNEVVLKTLALLEMQPLFHNIKIQLSLDENLTSVLGNATRLNQVFMNIIVNAAQAMEGKGALSIASRLRSNREIVEVVVQDSGPGIAPDILQRIFDPFFTTKAHGEGTGLGLSISYAIIKEHKGTVRVASTLGQGAAFTLRFPIWEPGQTGEPS
ncbi:MAG: PAS domain S-box protein [Myxococcales bacterium]|nr:MAG: PAS domain S-box protein [Myxococcales bacterium]